MAHDKCIIIIIIIIIYGNTDEIGLHNKENKDILEQKHLISQIYGMPIHYFYTTLSFRNSTKTMKRRGKKTPSIKTVSCKCLKISLSESYKVVLITSHYVQVNFL